MSKRLTKRTRSLLFAVVALAVVGVLLIGLLLLLPAPEENPDDDTTVDESVVLFDKSDDSDVVLSSVDIAFGDTAHTISITDDELYTVKGYEDLPLDQAVLAEVADSLLTITASRLVLESPENPADFGFGKADSSITVSASYSDKSAFSFEIGDLSPSQEGYYLRESGKDAVYLMDTAFCQTMAYETNEYINHMPITAPSAQESTDSVVVRDATLTGTVRPQTIFFQITEQPEEDEENMVISGYAIQKPYFHAVDSNSQLISYSTFTSLTATGVAKLRPTATDLNTYGLSKPYSVCTVNLSLQRTTETEGDNGEIKTQISYHSTFQYTIKLGNTDKDGNYYGVVYAEKTLIPVVYLFAPSAVSSWVDAQYEDVADDMLYFQYITNLTSIGITNNGEAKTFVLEHFPDEEDSDKSLTVTADGTTYSTADFRTLYASLLSLYRVGATDETPTGTPVLTLTFTPMKQHGDAVRIDIYGYNAGYYLAVHNSGEKHLVSAREVQNIQSVYEKILAGKSLS
ncbi:MAG: DUF4340 domain-containing protein [Clostridia bacterium]|nr:DUF4340 domain-containing protein [Clostridia bacterium]